MNLLLCQPGEVINQITISPWTALAQMHYKTKRYLSRTYQLITSITSLIAVKSKHRVEKSSDNWKDLCQIELSHQRIATETNKITTIGHYRLFAPNAPLCVRIEWSAKSTKRRRICNFSKESHHYLVKTKRQPHGLHNNLNLLRRQRVYKMPACLSGILKIDASLRSSFMKCVTILIMLLQMEQLKQFLMLAQLHHKSKSFVEKV